MTTTSIKNKSSVAKTMLVQDGKINDVSVKITRPVCLEYIAMVGHAYDTSVNNRLVFAAQAIRIIRQEYLKEIRSIADTNPKVSIIITVALMNQFGGAYSDAQLAAIEESINKIKGEHGLTVIKNIRLRVFKMRPEATTCYAMEGGCHNGGIDEVAHYINNGEVGVYPRRLYLIRRLDIFSHGYPGKIVMDLYFSGKGKEKLILNEEAIKKWSPSAFKNGELYSWACRTGVTIATISNKKISLASQIASSLGVNVYCYYKRSEYANTWGETRNRIFFKACQTDFIDVSRLRKSGIPLFEDVDCLDLNIAHEEREKFKREIGAVWMEDGAVCGVECGISPLDLPHGFYLFRPNKNGERQD